MGIMKDWNDEHRGVVFNRKLIYFFSPKVWFRLYGHRKQRANRGWSEQDTWNGGEHIMEVTAGILRYLDKEQNPIDWAEYFRTNYENNYGYKSLSEVAQDIENYLGFEELQYSEPLLDLDIETRIAIGNQLYEEAREAMAFTAKNIGGLWW